MRNCRECGAPVSFVPTTNGRKAIVDAAPVKVWVRAPGAGGAFEVKTAFQDHHATCTDAEKFREGRS